MKSVRIDLILSAIVFGVFIIMAVNTIIRARRVEKNGIDTVAVVSRIEWSGGGEDSDSYNTYVVFFDEKGEQVERLMASSPVCEYTVGQEVMIRFLPEEKRLVRDVSHLKNK